MFKLIQRNFSSVNNKHQNMVLEKINPQANSWNQFLGMSMDYLLENWPSHFNGRSIENVRSSYDKEVRQRLLEPGRELHFLVNETKPIGFINAYKGNFVLNQKPLSALYIAEFYIAPEHRRIGFGTSLFHRTCDLASKNQQSIVAAEVDKDLVKSNLFWSKLIHNVETHNPRNLYWKQIQEK